MTAPTAPSPGLGEREAVARTEEMTSEEIAKIWAEELHHQPAPPPTPVRGRYYLTECEHCGWIGSSEHLGVCEDDISCPVCCQSICGDGPNEADTAKHGEAVYQRIVTAEAEASTLRAENETLRAKLAQAEGEIATMRLAEADMQARAAKICDEAAAYFDRTNGHYDRSQAARSYRHSADSIRRLPFQRRALTNPEPPHGD